MINANRSVSQMEPQALQLPESTPEAFLQVKPTQLDDEPEDIPPDEGEAAGAAEVTPPAKRARHDSPKQRPVRQNLAEAMGVAADLDDSFWTLRVEKRLTKEGLQNSLRLYFFQGNFCKSWTMHKILPA